MCAYLFLTCGYPGVAKENLRKKNPNLMKKFSVIRFGRDTSQRATDKPLPLPPKVDIDCFF